MFRKPFSLALVTGATSGIGKELAYLLASKNIPLIVTGRDQGRLKDVADDLSRSIKVTSIVADLTTEEGRGLIAEAIRKNIPDLVVNCAGFGLYGEATELSINEQLQLVDVDVKSVVQFSLEAVKSLQGQGKNGTVLNVSSAAGFLVFPYFATYAAAKAFVTSFSQSLDFELGQQGIRVLASCPGVVETGFRTRAGGVHKSGEARMTVRFAAEEIWKQILSGQRVHVFDLRTRVGIFIAKYFLPTSFVAKRVKESIKSFLNHRNLS